MEYKARVVYKEKMDYGVIGFSFLTDVMHTACQYLWTVFSLAESELVHPMKMGSVSLEFLRDLPVKSTTLVFFFKDSYMKTIAGSISARVM